MHEYHVVLKLLFQNSLEHPIGKTIVHWLSTELPKAQNLYIDANVARLASRVSDTETSFENWRGSIPIFFEKA
jgi:hypothetical protein